MYDGAQMSSAVLRGLLLCVLSCAFLLVGCSEESPPSTQGVGRSLPPPQPRARPAASIYDEDGVPRESDESVAGLTLPLGLEEIEALGGQRRHVYRSRIPAQNLLRYFGPRLNTLEIERTGESVTYRNATVQHGRQDTARLDVTIEPTSSGVSRVEVRERRPPPPAGTVVSDEQIRAHLDSLGANRRE